MSVCYGKARIHHVEVEAEEEIEQGRSGSDRRAHYQECDGIEHYRRAGKKGFMVTVARHWAGDKWSYIRYLHECGWLTEVLRHYSNCAAGTGPDGIKSIEIPLLPGELEEEELWQRLQVTS